MDGTQVFIDGIILQKLEATRPEGLSLTGWVNFLLDVAVVHHRQHVGMDAPHDR